MRFILPAAILLLVAPSLARAGGVVEGVVRLAPMKPAPVKPGYQPQTSKPVGAEEQPAAIVYLEGPAAAQAAAPPQDARIVQEGYQFRPALLAVRTGASVEFPNGDDEFHNVFSYSKTKRFDLGRFRKTEPSPRVTFDRPGLVKVYCEIHQHMRCMILVLDTPLFTTTDATGKFKLAGVPAGDYTLKVFLASEKTLESRVTVREGQTTTASVQQ